MARRNRRKDFPVLRNSRSRYAECNNDDIPYSSKFLQHGMFVIEVINHMIVAVLLEIRVFHLRLMLLYRGIFYLQFVNGTIIGKSLLLVLFSMYFGRCSSFGNSKINANGANTNAGWKYETIGQLIT